MAQFYVIFVLILQISGLLNTSSAQQAAKSAPSDRKPHLNCILFGNTACQITCDILCDLYGCRSNAVCVDQVSCECNEIYTVRGKNVTAQQYQNLSIEDLWAHNMKDSFAASRTYKRIIRNEELCENITTLLHNPHITGEYIRSELQVIHSPWTYVYYIRPLKRGNYNKILDEKYAFNYEKFKSYFNATMASIVNRTYDKIQRMDNADALPNLIQYLANENNVRYIVSQVLWFPNNSLLNLINEYTHRNKYDFFTQTNNATLLERENTAYESFKAYLAQAIENLVDQVFGKMQEMKQKQLLPRLMSYVNDRQDIKHLISLILMFPDDSLYSLMRNLVLQNRNDTYTVQAYKTYQFIDPQDIDELVSASVLESLLKIKTQHPEATTPATTTTPSTTQGTTESLPFRFHIQRLLKETFGLRKSNEGATLKDGKKSYPELQQILTQLMEYLVNSGNTKPDA